MEKDVSKPQKITHEDRFWKKHIAQYKKSTLSKLSYAKENSLPYHRFLYWYNQSEQQPIKKEKLIPIKVERESQQDFPLCVLENNQGHRLFIHDFALAQTLLSGF